jgi:hypothetical protein
MSATAPIPPTTPGPLPGAPGRKAASWFNAVVLALALTACCVLAVLMTTRAHKRFDVTATRQHDLTPRTKQLLSRLDRDLTLVVAADMSTLDHPTRQRTLDVLEQFSSAGGGKGRLKVNLINTSDPAGQQNYERVLADLIARDKPTIDAASAAVTAAVSKAEAIAATLESLQQTLLKLKDQQIEGSGSTLNAHYLNSHAGVIRVGVQDLRVGVTNAKAHVASPDPMLPVPAIDKALAELKKPVAAVSQALAKLGDDFDSLAKDPRSSESDKAAAGLLLPQLRSGRDGAGTLSADLEAVPMPRVLSIARALQMRRAALLIDEDAKPGAGIGVQAIDADTLLAVGGQGVDLRARTEDLIAGAVGRMSSGIRPVVCIVHGAPTRLAAADWPMLQRVRQQLSMRGIEMVEWPVALEREMPRQVATDTVSRPVVFVTITAQGGRDAGGPQGVAAGIAAFARALDNLVASGRNVLLSVNLSQVPASGSPDPLTECLKPLGIEVDSGRPLLQSDKVETRQVARTRQDLFDPHATHPISGAIRDLRLRLQWPVTITYTGKTEGNTAVRFEPIVTIPADGTLWAESEWQEFYRTVTQAKGDYTRITNPPAKDSPRDGSAGGETWTLAAAVEGAAPGQARQRIVVVGANGWFQRLVPRRRRRCAGKLRRPRRAGLPRQPATPRERGALARRTGRSDPPRRNRWQRLDNPFALRFGHRVAPLAAHRDHACSRPRGRCRLPRTAALISRPLRRDPVTHCLRTRPVAEVRLVSAAARARLARDGGVKVGQLAPAAEAERLGRIGGPGVEHLPALGAHRAGYARRQAAQVVAAVRADGVRRREPHADEPERDGPDERHLAVDHVR